MHVFLPQETVPFEAGPALWSMHPAEAPLHRDGVYGERLPAGLPPGEEREAQEGGAAEHVPGHMRRDGVSGEKLLHSQGLSECGAISLIILCSILTFRRT